jgi:hypothetical protein
MRSGFVRRCVAFVMASLLVMTGELSAQTDRGTIQGLVTDSTGAVVPSARVEIVQADTNSTVTLATNGDGFYTVPNLPRGRYRVVVSKDGFTASVTEDIDLRGGVQIRADVTLQPGGVQEQVVVTAANVDVSSINNSATLSEQLINELPVIVTGTKRDITSLLANLPGFTGGGTFVPRANGANVGDTEVFVDGGRSSQFIQRGAFAEVGPAIEQVGEFSVVSNGFNAEYGGVGIWFTNVTIKSGTNRFSGSIFDHFGTDALNARSFFQAAKSDYKQHEGGFTFGGPVVLPKYDGRNRTFFFGSVGLFFSRSGSGGALITVPTEAFLRGDFSGLVDAQGRQIPIYDPATTRPDGRGGFVRDPFPGNMIPADRISAAARMIAQYIPRPDLPGNVNNFRDRKAPTWPYFDTYTPLGKVDHNINDAQRLSVMFTRQVRHRILWGNPGSGLGEQPAWGKEQSNPLDWITDQQANSWKLRANHDHVLSSQMINHVTVSVDGYRNEGRNKTAGQDWATRLGIGGLPAGDGSFPAINFQGGTAIPVNFGRAYDEDWSDVSVTINENLTRSIGSHTLKFGGEAGRYTVDRFFTGGAGGAFTFSNFTTSQPNAGAAFATQGSAVASFLLGEVFQASALIPVATAYQYQRYALFAQDEWRATPALTVSYGLRWDYQPPMTEASNRMSSFIPDLPNPRAGGLPGALAFAETGGFGRNFQDKWYRGFGPRLGASYAVDPKTVVRGSFGVYYNGTANQTMVTPIGFVSTPSFTSPDNFTPVFNWSTATFPQTFSRPPVTDPAFANGQAVFYDPPAGGRLPQVTSWMAGVQREVTKALIVDISYIGSRSTHQGLPPLNSQLNYVPIEQLALGNLLLQPITSAAAIAAGYVEPFPGFANQLGANTVAQALKRYPQYTSITAANARLTEGESRYHSVQLRGTKRFSGGLSLVSFLTWMKNESNTNYTFQYPGDSTLRVDPGTPPWVFGASWVYELPFGQGRRYLTQTPAVVDSLIGGWQFAGAVRYQSGAALAITSNNNLGPLGYSIKYADRVEDVDVYRDERGGFDPLTDRYLNAAAFAVPSAFALGNTGGPLAYVRGFAQKSESFSISKQVRLADSQRIEVGLDITNPFNFVRWNDPNTNISSGPAFGSVTGTQPGRTMQVNVSYGF